MAKQQGLSFGADLRRLRQAAGLTQEQLAGHAGLTVEAIRALEHDERKRLSPHMVEALVAALQLRDHKRAALLAAISGHQVADVPDETRTDSPNAGAVAGDAQTSPLLLMKIHAPRVTTGVVDRPRLLARLRAGVDRALTLVAAPAGYGKTTLVAQQLAALPEPSAWLSLDSGDNDPATFARYLVAAVRSVTASVSGPTRNLVQAAAPRLESVLLSLSNDLAALPHDLIVVLDDYHLLTNPTIHAAMAFLLDHLPPLLHFVIVTREDPPFPLAKLRARRQLVEIRAADLRFTAEETASFLHEEVGQSLRAEDVARLGERTEGWIAGLHLAALSLQQHGAASASEFVAAFNGSNRFLVDYLLDEVIAQLPAHTRTFLLSTSILERLCGPLCDAVLDLAPDSSRVGGSSEASYSQDILVELERRHLFLIPLDAERRWYRYHHLFADVLQQRLHAGASDHERAVLHARASGWFAAQGLIVEAVHHATHAGDWEATIRLVEQHGLLLMLRGHVHTVLSWLHQLPPSALGAHPFVHVIHGAALLFTNQLPAAEARLQEVQQLVVLDAGDQRSRAIHGTALLVRANLARFRGDLPRFLSLAQQALDTLPPAALLQRSVARANLTSAFVVTGDVSPVVERAFIEALEQVQLNGDLNAIVRGKVALATLQRLQGRLGQAEATLGETAVLMGHADVNAALVDSAAYFVGLGDLLRERNDLDAAERRLTEGRSLVYGTVITSADVVIQGHIASARLRAARGDSIGARRLLDDALAYARERGFADDMVRRLHAEHAQLALLDGDQDAALFWAAASGMDADDEVTFLHESAYLTLARVYIAEGRRDPRGARLDDARRLIDRWLVAATEGGRWGSVIELLILRALALAAQGDEHEALAALGQALHHAAPEGYVRIFVDEGKAIHALLRMLKTAGASRTTPYVDTLLAAFTRDRPASSRADAQEERTAPTSAETASLPPGAEALTERETHVLRLMASGASNQAIADHLVISLPTAKKHVANILGKLQVHNRTEAVARARALQLL